MISDLTARQQALNPEQSFIVQAPAGSGKTGLLVYRYLTLLTRVEKPQNVLAITFTRKARAEMRERIIELLMAARQDQKSDDAFEQQGIDLAAQVLERDAAGGWQLLYAPHQMQILTIDAFCAKLAASMPWLSRLGERPRTTDSADAHFALAVEQVMDELLIEGSEISAALQVVMHELDFNYDKARRLFASMLSKRDQWLRHILHNPSLETSDQTRLLREKAWSVLVDEALAETQNLFDEDKLNTLLSMAIEASQRIDYTAPRAVQSMRVFTSFEGGIRDLTVAHWKALSDFLLVKTGDKVRSTVDKNLGFPAGHAAKKLCLGLFQELSEDTAVIQAFSDIMSLPEPRFSDADWQKLVSLETVLKALAVHLQLRFRSAGECDHSEVAQRANMALAELNNPTDLGLLMDGQIHHILVDEFQDTSNAQLSLLQKLTAGWQLNDSPARTLFLVGDPMQSIYRFREADVGLFLQVANNTKTAVFENIDIASLTLSQNFRSSQSLVNWFNTTFEKSFPSSNDALTGAICYASAHSARQDGNQNPVSYYLANDRVQEAEALLAAVQTALPKLPDERAQIAILVRTRPQLDYLLPLLDNHGIAYTAVDIQPLHEQQAIQDTIALCQAICREDDRLAWLALLRGPWCGLNLQQLHLFAHDHKASIWQSLNEAAKQRMLDADAQARLRRFLGVMRASKKQHQQVDLGSLTRWAWQQLGGIETLADTQQQDVEQVFDLLNSLQRGGDLPSKKDLNSALLKMRACNTQGEHAKVVVSTIHKSKGLQYHTVILPGLANPPRSDDREVLMWAEHQGSNGETNLLLAPLVFDSAKSAAPQSSHYQYLRKLDSKRAASEVMRLMYVACTRAEKKLILLGRLKEVEKNGEKTGELRLPAKGTLLASVWFALEGRFSLMPHTGIVEAQGDKDLDQTLLRLPAEYQSAVGQDFVWQAAGQLNKPEPSEEQAEIIYDWATEVATAVGILLHDFLQFAGSQVLNLKVGDALKQRWRAEMLALRVPENRINYALNRLLTAIEQIQGDDQAHFIFADYINANNEYALSTLENGVVKKYRLDRTFVDAQGVRWIIDYKSTSTQSNDVDNFVDQQVAERHKPQLDKYGELMSKIDSRPIKLAVYFPLLKQLRVWDYS